MNLIFLQMILRVYIEGDLENHKDLGLRYEQFIASYDKSNTGIIGKSK